MLNSDNTFKSNEELRTIFEEKGVDLTKHIVNTCGSGMTASVNFMALELLNIQKKSLYDGSWTEFGQKPEK